MANSKNFIDKGEPTNVNSRIKRNSDPKHKDHSQIL